MQLPLMNWLTTFSGERRPQKLRLPHPDIWLFVLPTAWLVLVATQGILVFVPAIQISDWLNRFSGGSGYGGLLLLLGLGGWIAVLSLVRARRGRVLPAVLISETIVACTVLVITSQEALAALTTVWLTIVGGLVGFAILRALKIHLEAGAILILSISLGWGVLAILTLAAGIVGVLYRDLVLVASLFVVLILAWGLRHAIIAWAQEVKIGWQNLPPVPWLAFACLVLLSLFFMINWIGALAPDVRFDALKAHLALAQTYAKDHRVTALNYSMGSYLAHER